MIHRLRWIVGKSSKFAARWSSSRCALALGGCGKPEPKPTGTVLVSMADNSYSPAIVRVPVGGSIVFMNVGRNDHNVFAVDKSWSSEKTFGNIKLQPGDMTEIVFTKEGVYPVLLQLSCDAGRQGGHGRRRRRGRRAIHAAAGARGDSSGG